MLESDPLHCGACDIECSLWQTCRGGECEDACGPDQDVCDGQCTSLLSDNAHCGVCDVECGPGESCRQGSCTTLVELACDADQKSCRNARGLYCANVLTDAANCGACGTACAPGQTCHGGECVEVVELLCGEGQQPCGGTQGPYCANLLTDTSNCGGCAVHCGDNETCRDGTCIDVGIHEFVCDGQQALCVGDQGPYCANVLSDTDNCGGCQVFCADNETCQNGSCVSIDALACDNDQKVCAGVNGPYCANVLTDEADCGVCGNVCAVGSWCDGGACSSVCEAPLEACPGPDGVARCVDLDKSRAHCGACGVSCLLGYETCEDGQCVAYCSTDRFHVVNQAGGGPIEQGYFTDVDGDGDLDVLVRDPDYSPRLHVLVQGDDGQVSANEVPDQTEACKDLDVADMDGDGFMDMVTATQTPIPKLMVWWGTGSTTFTPSEHGSGACQDGQDSQVVLGDFDEDGLVDALLACGGSSYTVFLNQGERSLTALDAVQQPHHAFPLEAQAADLNADGHLDLVVGVDDHLCTFAGDGTGRFAEPQVIASPSSMRPAPAIGDINGDGYPDFVSGPLNGTDLTVYLSQAGSGFVEASRVSLGEEAVDAHLWDVDEDGLLDLAVALGTSATDSFLAVARGFGDGSFGAPSWYAGFYGTYAQGQTRQIDAVDFDDDGIWEIAALGGGVNLVERLGNGTLAAPRVLRPGESAITAMVVTSVNGDAVPDYVVADAMKTLTVYAGSGNGGTGASRSISLGYEARAIWPYPAGSDLDLFIDTDSERVLRCRASAMWSDVPVLNVVEEVALPLDSGPVVVADVTGDGKADLLVANTVESRWDLIPYDPETSAFSESVPFAVPYPGQLRASDVDGDGHQDVVVPSLDESEPHVCVFYGNSTGSFEEQALSTSTLPYQAAVVDLDLDGLRDLALLSNNQVLWLRATGPRTFGTWQMFAEGGTLGGLDVDDVQGDEAYDLVVRNTTPSEFWLWPATSSGPGLVERFPTGASAYAGAGRIVQFADVNGDGLMDAVVGENSTAIIVHEGQPMCE